MSRKMFKMVFGLGVLASVVLSAPSAHATYVVTLENLNGNVVATGSGSINLSSLSWMHTGGIYTEIGPIYSLMDLGGGGINGLPGSTSISEYYAFNVYGPQDFGSGGITKASSSSGSFVGLEQSSSQFTLVVPSSYPISNGGALGTSTATWDSTSLAGLGVTTGTYTWSWGTGANADSFILYAGVDPPSSSPSATPEPSTWVLFGTGILAMMGWTLRRQKAFQS